MGESCADEETLALIDDTDELDEVRVARRLLDNVGILEGRTVEDGVSATETVKNVLADEYKELHMENEASELKDANWDTVTLAEVAGESDTHADMERRFVASQEGVGSRDALLDSVEASRSLGEAVPLSWACDGESIGLWDASLEKVSDKLPAPENETIDESDIIDDA